MMVNGMYHVIWMLFLIKTKCSLCICWDLCSIIYFEYLLAKGQPDVDNLRT